jgi:hypothetical protein
MFRVTFPLRIYDIITVCLNHNDDVRHSAQYFKDIELTWMYDESMMKPRDRCARERFHDTMSSSDLTMMVLDALAVTCPSLLSIKCGPPAGLGQGKSEHRNANTQTQ